MVSELFGVEDGAGDAGAAGVEGGAAPAGESADLVASLFSEGFDSPGESDAPSELFGA